MISHRVFGVQTETFLELISGEYRDTIQWPIRVKLFGYKSFLLDRSTSLSQNPTESPSPLEGEIQKP